MRRSYFVFTLVAAIGGSALLIGTRLSSSETELNDPEISPQQYALLTNPDTIPDQRLDEVRQLLVDDGKISPEEFESLHICDAESESAKLVLFRRLNPDVLPGTRLHPNETPVWDGSTCGFTMAAPPRTESKVVTLGESTYQLRQLHFCGTKRVSGFFVYRDGKLWNTVRFFGHAGAVVYVNNGNPSLMRKDLNSEEAYRLLEAFYDDDISDKRFLSSIIDPAVIAAYPEPSAS